MPEQSGLAGSEAPFEEPFEQPLGTRSEAQSKTQSEKQTETQSETQPNPQSSSGIGPDHEPPWWPGLASDTDASSEPGSPARPFGATSAPAEAGRPPQPVLDGLWAFAPNRDCQGGTAWWLEHAEGALLIDCPAYTAANLAFLRERPAGMLLLTSREGHGRARRFQEALGWPVLVQEQEAYLLPGVQQLQTFGDELALSPGLRLLWTPGPTPGACVLHASGEPDVLFCGRLLSPTAPGAAAPLPTARSFHWGRWQRSLKKLKAWLPQGSPRWIASGAGLGALAGEKLIGPGRPLLDGLE